MGDIEIFIALLVLVLVVYILYTMYYPAKKEGFESTRVITLHYTNWCGYCKRMKPIWAAVKAAGRTGVRFVEIDEDVTKTPGITGYPTITKVDELGRKYTYNGPADYDALLTWVSAPTATPSF